MAHYTDKIMRILNTCHLNKDDYKDKSQNSNKSLEQIKSHAKKLLTNTPSNYIGCVEYASLNKILATCNLKVSNHFVIKIEMYLESINIKILSIQDTCLSSF